MGRVRVFIRIYGINEEHEAEIVETDTDGKPTAVFVTDSLVWGKLNKEDYELTSAVPNYGEVIN